MRNILCLLYKTTVLQPIVDKSLLRPTAVWYTLPLEREGCRMTLGQKIAAARKLKGWSQDALAERLGVSHQAVAKWEKDLSHPSTANLLALSKLLSLSLDEVCLPPLAKTSPEPQETTGRTSAHTTSIPLKIALFLLYLLLILGLLFAGGIGAMLLPTVFLLIGSGVYTAAVSVKAKGGEDLPAKENNLLKHCIIQCGLILLGALLCIGIWCIHFSITAQYRTKANWNIPEQKISRDIALSSWIEECREMSDGIYVISMLTPNTARTTRCLVFRHNMASDATGKIQAFPLRYKFVVTYPSPYKDAGLTDSFDLLEFSAFQDYHIEFNAKGQSESPAVFCGDIAPYEKAMDSLWGEFASGGL